MLYIGLDHHKRYALVNAIDEKELRHSDIFKQDRATAPAGWRQLES